MMGMIPQSDMSNSVVKYGLGYIRPYHREIARRLVLGQRQSDICRDLGMTPGRMSIIVNSPLFKIEIKKLERERDEGVGDISRTLQELSPLALEVVERTMYQAESHRLRFDAAESVLDRAGHSRINKSDINVTGNVNHSGMTEDELRKLVSERVKRMKEEYAKREAAEAEANSTPIEFDMAEQCPSDGQQERELIAKLLG